MGYTHYWTQAVGLDIPVENWRKIMADVTKLFVASPVQLADNHETMGHPIVTGNRIQFNGLGAFGNETFLLNRLCPQLHPVRQARGEKVVTNSCKTSHAPYDLIVTAVICVVHDHAKAYIRFNTDDASDQSSWKAGCSFASQTLGRKLTIPEFLPKPA